MTDWHERQHTQSAASSGGCRYSCFRTTRLSEYPVQPCGSNLRVEPGSRMLAVGLFSNFILRLLCSNFGLRSPNRPPNRRVHGTLAAALYITCLTSSRPPAPPTMLSQHQPRRSTRVEAPSLRCGPAWAGGRRWARTASFLEMSLEAAYHSRRCGAGSGRRSARRVTAGGKWILGCMQAWMTKTGAEFSCAGREWQLRVDVVG